MKLFKKIIALIMVAVMAFSSSVVVSAQTTEVQLNNVDDYSKMLVNEGYPVFTTEQFYKIFDVFVAVYRILTGKWMFPQQNFNVEVDEFLSNLSLEITRNSGLDFLQILENLPESNQLAEIVTTVFSIDTEEFRNQMNQKRDECREEGNSFMAEIYNIIGIYFSVIKTCEIYAQPKEDAPEIYEVYLKLVYKDGGYETMYPGLVINTVTGECTNNSNIGIFGTGFNFNLSEMLVYATVDCWMRQFGFCVFYDILANSMPVFFRYITRRFMFEYNGLEYMIQMWKGNYTVANGAEVGIYCRDKGSFGTFYNCANDDQMLNISMQLLHGDKVLINKEPELHWWCNGFNLSDKMYLPHSLTMKTSIEMTDEEMLNAFCESIDNHYMNDVTYTVDGLTVNVVW